MNVRRLELLIMFVLLLALNWLGTMWWLSGHPTPTARASEQAQAALQNVEAAQAATIPRTFGYQGTLRLANGSLANGAFDITFKLYNVLVNGEALYSETINGVVARDGLFSVVLGGNSEIPVNIFDNPPLYLGITVAPDAEMIPRQRLYPVPWAMQATTAATANGLTPGAAMTGILTLGAADGDDARVIAFSRDAGDEANAGKLAFKASWDPAALAIMGAGPATERKISLYDDVTVAGDLAVDGSFTLESDLLVNAIHEIGDSKGNPTTRQTYAVSTRRYVLEAIDNGVNATSVQVDDVLLTGFCQDVDGCMVTLGMRNWDPANGPGLLSTYGPYRFSISANKSNGTRDWDMRFHDGSRSRWGSDSDTTTTHALVAYNDCYFTDGAHSGGNDAGDLEQGFALLNWHDTYTEDEMVCVLIIED